MRRDEHCAGSVRGSFENLLKFNQGWLKQKSPHRKTKLSLTRWPSAGIFRADATSQSFFGSHVYFESGTSEDSEGFSMDSVVMVNVEHCRRDVTLM